MMWSAPAAVYLVTALLLLSARAAGLGGAPEPSTITPQWGDSTPSAGVSSAHEENTTTSTSATTASYFALNTSEAAMTPKRKLTLLGLFPMGGQWPGGRAMLPAAELALEHINARSDILEKYVLDIVWTDTECDPGVAVNGMYRLLYAPPVKHMVLGAGCSPVTEATATTSYLWNLTQISYVSASPALSNKRRFPRFFRVGSPELLLNPAKIELMRRFNWRRVATIHESIELFSTVTADLVKRLPEHNISLITSEIFSNDPSVQVKNLKKHDARIIFGGFHYAALYKVMCEAYRVGLYGSRYVWVLPGWFSYGWWSDDAYDGSTPCTAAQIRRAASGYIGLGAVFINPNEDIGVSGHTPESWKKEMSQKTDYPDLYGSYVAAQGYDATWAAALALNMTDAYMRHSGFQERLDDFTYDNSAVADIMLDKMWDVNFQGIKGPIYFNEFGDCQDTAEIHQFQGDARPVVAYFHPDSDDGIRWLQNSTLKWDDGHPPKDSTLMLTRLEFVTETAYGIMVAMATVGIITAFSLLVFNVVFRKQKLIKMSSPVLNNIILVGCIVSYTTVIFQERSKHQTYLLCKVRSFTIMVGFSLTFGALFVKTWRVYIIFTNKTKKTVLRDIQLLSIVAALVLLDVVAFVTQLIVDPHSVDNTIVSVQEEQDGDVLLHTIVAICSSPLGIYFTAIVYVIKGLLLVFGVFLAWQTRKVKIAALNDSKYIGMCIYNAVILSAVAVLLASVLSNRVTLQYVLVNSLLMIGVTLTQLIVFVPKIYKVWQIHTKVNLEDENQSEQNTHTVNQTAHGVCENPVCKSTIKKLQDECQTLRIAKENN